MSPLAFCQEDPYELITTEFFYSPVINNTLPPLRIQHRIRLHLNLFVSFILTSILFIMWNNLVNRDHIYRHPEETRLHRNTVGCRILNFLISYLRSTNYFCMFIEGYYLYRLLAATFERPKTLVGYYIFSWGFPLIPSLIYATIRGTMFNEKCWVINAEPYEWIMYVPNLLCIMANLFFLVYILLVLVGRLQNHANEPSNYRRTVKATLVLIPLFGLQQLLIIYRPSRENDYAYPYEIISSIIIHSQGGLVALVFCFFNREVHSHIRKAFDRLKDSSVRPADRSSYTTTTQFPAANTRSFIHLNGHSRLVNTNTGQSAKNNNAANYTPLTVIKEGGV
ncbi:calcitonin gene-related peptide type 1 receptor-like isoform X1 [Octopus vulgaris]|uniref:Calcitonin gene-related peptide type 1 receptor-like isoform X1 n=1 Tax=Octopus vulgaris TaxID=6645 RepID=A0AA36F6U3_OCTVU|nr:calcitonin gene-related peptide type 1 receptor-like isoform X1 [Octopus vulgaris]